jgi:hypothetical protein
MARSHSRCNRNQAEYTLAGVANARLPLAYPRADASGLQVGACIGSRLRRGVDASITRRDGVACRASDARLALVLCVLP